MDSRNNFHLDWLNFSFNPFVVKNDIFNEEDLTSESFSMYNAFLRVFPQCQNLVSDYGFAVNGRFYDCKYGFANGISISWDLTYKGKGLSVSIPAHALEEGILLFFPELSDKLNLTDYIGSENLYLIFNAIRKKACQVSRVDLAYDDYDKTFLPIYYERKYMSECISTRLSSHKYISCASGRGDTFYLGKRSSGRMIRIYDKDYESKGEFPCVRYEFELTQDCARLFAQWILDGNNICFTDYLTNEWFTIVDNKNVDKHNRSHCPINEEWVNWLESVKAIFNRENCSCSTNEYVAIPKKKKMNPTFESIYDWNLFTCSRNEFLIAKADPIGFINMLVDSEARLSHKQRLILNEVYQRGDNFQDLVQEWFYKSLELL